MTVSQFFTEKTVFLHLASNEKEAALRELLEALESTGELDGDDTGAFFAQILQREKLGSTGIGRGMAIPHIKSERISKGPVIAIGVSEEGIDFNSIDAEPVHTVFMILSPTDAADAHLEVLRGVSSLARDRDFLRNLRRVKTVGDMRLLIEDLERE